MIGLFYPHEYVDSVFSIDYPKLLALGYKGVIFDIDNTLVHHGEDATPEIASLLQSIHSCGLKTLLLTNNDENRVMRFMNTSIETLYICEADKPKPSNYLKALELMGLEPTEAVFVGDQVFTDTYGANRAGIKNILVRFLHRGDKKKIGLRRRLERIVLWTYALNQRYQHRLGDIAKSSS
jgi:HAD superfamily phosphatase (TIGR01668 family)